MAVSRRASLFRNGGNQAVRIPREFELHCDAVTITRDGNRLIIEPSRDKTLRDVLEDFRRRGPLPPEDQMPEIEDHPAEPVPSFRRRKKRVRP